MWKIPTILALIASVAGPVSMVAAEPDMSVCDIQARAISGYKDAPPQLETRVGRTNMRLSGSVALGVGNESGPPVGQAPAFAGTSAAERRERAAEAQRKQREETYRRALEDCLSGN